MTATQAPQDFDVLEKGLKPNALGLLSSVVVALASVAPAYSLAATIGFIVIAVGLQAPVIMILAFIPMICVAIGYKELNEAEPDSGTIFVWASRTFGPRTGWMGGWGVITADVVVMANLAAIAGTYFFLLFNADGIAATLFWPTVVGVAWIVIMTIISYVGIEVSARLQYALLGIELVALALFSIIALVRIYTNNAISGTSLQPRWSWFNPFQIDSFDSLASALLLAVFIYWGFDTALSVNEETKDPRKTPGKAGVIAVFVLLGTYVLVTVASQAIAGISDQGIGLGNADNATDVFAVLARAVFGDSTFGNIGVHILILMVLSSAAASTLTTILPTARTVFSMGFHQAVPKKFAGISKYMTPTWATIGMGLVSIIFYVGLTWLNGNVLADTIASIGLLIAFYFGMVGFTCPVFYRHSVFKSPRNFVQRGVLPLLGGLILLAAFLQALHNYWQVGPDADSTTFWTVPGLGWEIGGIAMTGLGALLLGVVLMIITWIAMPKFFRGETLPKRSGEELESFLLATEKEEIV
ncbi:MAG: APC family permease [Actinomycetes bacterium]